MLRRWFLPESPDVVGMLRNQAAITAEGIDALLAWTAATPAAPTGCAPASTAPTSRSAPCAGR